MKYSAVIFGRMDPFEVRNGATQYSRHLISKICDKHSHVAYVCASSENFDHTKTIGTPENLDILQVPPNGAFARAWNLLILRLPLAVSKYYSKDRLKIFKEHWRTGSEIYFDHLASIVRVASPNLMACSYVSHNDEYLVRRDFGTDRPWLKPLFRYDAIRIKKLESAFSDNKGNVFAISKSDSLTIGDRLNRNATIFYPGFDWRSVEPITLNTESNALLLYGSANWSVKRENLVSFLDDYSGDLGQIGVKLVVAGNMPDWFKKKISLDYPDVNVLGYADDERTLIQSVRCGVLFGELGGGFRLTSLNFSLYGLPFFAPPELVSDLGLAKSEYFRYSDKQNDLVQAVKRYFHDRDALQFCANSIRRRAIEFCDAANDFSF